LIKLTDRFAAAATPPPGKHDHIFWDTVVPGFGLRMRRDSQGRITRRWIFQYDISGRTRRETLGDPAIVRCAAARQRARELRAKVQLGGDPQDERLAARRAVRFGARAEEYLAEIAGKLRPRTFDLRQRHLRLHCKPLHPLPAPAITRADLLALLTDISRTRGKVAANRCASTLTGMFFWLMLSGIVAANPMVGIRPHPERSRERVLSDPELVATWLATGSGSDFDRCVRLLLLTGCRRNEIGGLRWSEISGDLLVVSGERAKNARPLEVPLHPLAIAQLPPRMDGRDTVFGRGEAGFVGWSRPKARLDRRIGAIDPWSLHDLRRTAATWLSEHDVEPHIVEAVLGHVSGASKRGVAGVYNRAPYRLQKRLALARWAEHIAATTGQDMANVAALARAGA
jgi:integrase